jgi:hypothetical protein
VSGGKIPDEETELARADAVINIDDDIDDTGETFTTPGGRVHPVNPVAAERGVPRDFKEGDVLRLHAEGSFSVETLLVCPICGLAACCHNLPFVEAAK